MSKLGIIAALPAEAACLYNKNLNICAPVEIQKDIFLCLSGIGDVSASNAAKKLLEYKIDSIISWGVAGALDIKLNSGDLIFADSVISQNETFQTSTDWKNKLLEHVKKSKIKVHHGNIVSSKEVCSSISDKNNLSVKTNAVAVDMESAAIAKIASKNNLDFIVIRSIADKADTTIPEAVVKYTNNLGRPNILKFVLSCILRPAQIREIYILAKSYKLALKTLVDLAPDFKKENFLHI